MSYLANFFFQISGQGSQISGRSPLDRADQSAELLEKPSIPKLVFLHGAMGFSANWRQVAKAFESEFQILVYDQRGHGRSFQPSSGYAPEDYAGDLEKILDELGWARIYLVGHSMGGRVALSFASRYPERVSHLVIEDIGPGALQPVAANFVIQLLDSVPVPFASRREAKTWFDTEFMELFKDVRQREGLAAFLYANIKENDRHQAVWRFYERGIRESIEFGRAAERWQELAELTVPTLVIRGQYSKDLPQDVFEKMQAINPRVEGVEIPGAGHWVHSDQPDLFIQAVQRFFHAAK